MQADRRTQADAKLEEALAARETPFGLATIITACWRYAVGDDDGASYGLIEHGHILWSLIERTIQFERAHAGRNSNPNTTLPERAGAPLIPPDIMRQIALDIGKKVAAHIETMYPKAVEAATPEMLFSVRKRQRLEARRRFRKKIRDSL